MLSDDISEIAKKDKLIMKFGEMLYNQHPNSYMLNYIRQRMRQSSRLLKCVRECNEDITSMTEMLKPVHFDEIIDGVKKACKFDEKSSQYGIGGLPLKMGHNLKRIAQLKKSEAIKESNKEERDNATDFSDLLDMNWKYLISRQALSTLSDRRYNKPDLIPLAKDVKEFNDYLNERIAECILEVENENLTCYRELGSVTLCSVLVFNRRRSGETQRLSLQNFTDGMNSETICPEAEGCLSNIEKNILKSIKRIEIKGKRGRKVPVLLRIKHITAINLLVKHRLEAGVAEGNEFIFARTNFQSVSPLDACQEMRENSKKALLSKPALLRSTKLRKQVATHSQLLSLDQTELEQLSQFMGHSLHIHMDYYRLPVDVVQIAKVSKILFAVESGKSVTCHGGSIDDVQISGEPFKFLLLCF